MRINISVEIERSRKNVSKSSKEVSSNKKVIHDWCEAMAKVPDTIPHGKP